MFHSPRSLRAFYMRGGGIWGGTPIRGSVFPPSVEETFIRGRRMGASIYVTEHSHFFGLPTSCASIHRVWRTAFAWLLSAAACHPALSLEAMMSHGLAARRQNLFPMENTVPEQCCLPCHTHKVYEYGLRDDNERDRGPASPGPYEQAAKAGNRVLLGLSKVDNALLPHTPPV